MFRKLTIAFCLISFTPFAVGAQGLTTLDTPPAAVAAARDLPPSTGQDINLSLPAASSTTMLMAAADTSKSAAMVNTPDRKSESRSAHSWDNFVDVHFGDYRWVWWAGAAAILIGIHAAAAN